MEQFFSRSNYVLKYRFLMNFAKSRPKKIFESYAKCCWTFAFKKADQLKATVPIAPPKGIEVRDVNLIYVLLYQLLVTIAGITVLYFEIPSKLIAIMNILENNTF